MTDEIKQHQRWKSRDKRDNGKTIDIIRVMPITNPLAPPSMLKQTGGGHVLVTTGSRQTTMTFKTLRTRYENVH